MYHVSCITALGTHHTTVVLDSTTVRVQSLYEHDTCISLLQMSLGSSVRNIDFYLFATLASLVTYRNYCRCCDGCGHQVGT